MNKIIDKSKVISMLEKHRFVLDSDSYKTWYDEHPDRKLYGMFIEVEGPYMADSFRMRVFKGGYGNEIGETRSVEELEYMILNGKPRLMTTKNKWRLLI